jgi:RNA polymerase sigma-70 factor (ECF subfamily)
MVRYFIRAFRVSEEDAEELTQEAWIRFLDAMDEYRGDAEWGFLETIALRVGLNKLRSKNTLKRRAVTVDLDDPGVREQPAAKTEPDYIERQEKAEQWRRTDQEIEKLPPGQRQCIRLQLEGYKFHEIAQALRISVDAVKSRLRDARRTLRAKLGDDNTLPEDEQ